MRIPPFCIQRPKQCCPLPFLQRFDQISQKSEFQELFHVIYRISYQFLQGKVNRTIQFCYNGGTDGPSFISLVFALIFTSIPINTFVFCLRSSPYRTWPACSFALRARNLFTPPFPIHTARCSLLLSFIFTSLSS